MHLIQKDKVLTGYLQVLCVEEHIDGLCDIRCMDIVVEGDALVVVVLQGHHKRDQRVRGDVKRAQ